ncbi:sterol O-acyltransferase 2-like [Tiliqua scincoides]|uniref:sterol O-acyltransferase 2-like n=1 Tax=Tiliqua scincoides TaxID=71010 RepID=UPI0034629F12
MASPLKSSPALPSGTETPQLECESPARELTKKESPEEEKENVPPSEGGGDPSQTPRILKSTEKGQLREKPEKKVFIAQQSLLDELLEIKHFRSIYHIFVAFLCVFALSTIIVDSSDEGRLVLDFELFIFAFGNLPRALFTWLCMFLYTLLVPYKFLQMWASALRTAVHPRLFTATTVVVLLVCHAVMLGFYPIYAMGHYHLGPASCLIVILEQVRFLMKSHSFLRESVPPILYAKSKDGKVHPPEFSTYLYFLFCPTLIYRESYPRTPYVRWSYVIKNFAQFLGCMFFIYLVMDRHCIPFFSNMSKQPFSLKTLVLSIFNAILPGTLLLLLGFFGFLHCWQNAFAEMLRFADRAFYKTVQALYKQYDLTHEELTVPEKLPHFPLFSM